LFFLYFVVLSSAIWRIKLYISEHYTFRKISRDHVIDKGPGSARL